MNNLLPREWRKSKLGSLCFKIVDGTHFKPIYTDEGVPFLRVTDVQSKDINFEKIKYISHNEHRELIKRTKPQRGDILYSKNGTIGIPKIVDWDWEFSIFVSLALIRVKDTDSLNDSYLFQCLKSNYIKEQIRQRAKQGTVTNLHLEEIREFDIPLPSLKEQRKIAEILTSVDKVIELTEVNIEKLKNLKKGMMQDLLTKGIGHTKFKDSPIGKIPESWKFVSLKDCLKVSSGSGLSQKDMIEGPYKVYGGNGVNGSHNEMTENDSRLIIGRVGAHCGNVHITEPTSWITDNALIVSLQNNSDLNFWYYKLISLRLNELAYTGAQPVITGGIIYPFKVAVPNDPTEEIEISKRFISADQVILNKKRKLIKLNDMKKGLMQDLLTGKVRVKV
jgi:type I restriction enzyme S subunit